MSKELGSDIHILATHSASNKSPIILNPSPENINENQLAEFMSLHKEVTDEVLKGRRISVGNQNDLEWKFAKGELIISWTTPTGVTITSRQEISANGVRWKDIRPYVIAVLMLAGLLVAVLYGKQVLEAITVLIKSLIAKNL